MTRETYLRAIRDRIERNRELGRIAAAAVRELRRLERVARALPDGLAVPDLPPPAADERLAAAAQHLFPGYKLVRG